MYQHALCDRADRALRRSQALHLQHRDQLRRSTVEAERRQRLLCTVQALHERYRLQPRARLEAAWQAIAFSDVYGTLRERRAILLLADALLTADKSLETLASG